MDAGFWHQRWKNNEINFHESEVNPLLVKNIDRLNLKKGSRIFVPLCGKTLDISWLLSMGYQVVGAELSELAIEQLFRHLKIKAGASKVGGLSHYKAKNIDIFVGDIFDLTAELLCRVDAIYDRAGLVALPIDVRKDYTNHLVRITDTVRQLLICYEYDPKVMAGPPFSITREEVEQHYSGCYELTHLGSTSVEGGLKGESAFESVYILRTHRLKEDA